MRRRWLLAAIPLPIAALVLTIATYRDLRPLPEVLSPLSGGATATRILDRHGMPLNVTLENRWNVHEIVPLHKIPAFLQLAFVHAEDKRFYTHSGPDWIARASALLENIMSLQLVRGASTISEQVVRMLNPRPRTVWSRWLEGIEAGRLERRFGKDRILEFYLNQVPYAANRRGVRQAADYYFARDLETLSRKEMLVAAVLVRAPSRLNLYRSKNVARSAAARLADTMVGRGAISPPTRNRILAQELMLERPKLKVSAPHFVRFVKSRLGTGQRHAPTALTTLDAGLQRDVQRLLDHRLEQLSARRVSHGAVLIADNATREVLAWVVAGGGEVEARSHIDAIQTRRQPGSALKPFLYALALESGWSAANIIDDAPLSAHVGSGLHAYRNYSRRFYGPVTLRDALGNSLNIPAVKTLRHVGAAPFLATLRTVGFSGLTSHPEVYGDGIALGNGAVSLFELVQGYLTIANRGVFRPLRVFLHADQAIPTRQVFTPEIASIIADILSDPVARAVEFGTDSVLHLPVQTAVKTGTSSDFRDAWTIGFNSRHTVGVWMGNLDNTPSHGLTGSTGPAMVLKSVFSRLTHSATKPLYLSPRLRRRSVCLPTPASAVPACTQRAEWFQPGTMPLASVAASRPQAIRITQPSPGLHLAVDPRLPADSQMFEFLLEGITTSDQVYWTVDNETHQSRSASYLWQVTRGHHRVQASVWRRGQPIAELNPIEFIVK